MLYVGLDLGQRQDYSALAVVERFDPRRIQEEGAAGRETLVIRHLERMALGTPYVEVTRRVAEVMGRPAMERAQRLVVDATGVGMPVVEMLVGARMRCTVTPVLITGGFGEHSDGRVWHVPKVDLLSGLQGLLERGELKIARRMRERGTFERELLMVQARVKRERVRMGAEGSGAHDDLVIAVALACWAGRKGRAREQGERLYW